MRNLQRYGMVGFLVVGAPAKGCPPRAADGVWCDPDTSLCWQNPGKDGLNANDRGVIPSEAVAYCDALELAGHDDWRLPTIDELRSIVAGSATTATGGACPVTTGARRRDGYNAACLGSNKPHAGPGANGCYWKAGLLGLCNKPDPAVVGHPLETWALDPAADDPQHWVAYVTFDTGAAAFNHACSLGEARCVRGGDPPPCELGGRACRDFFPSRAHCDQDLTPEADKLSLTVHLPSPVDAPPHQLLAFLYDADGFEFPPLGPPDGGTDYDQIIAPDIDAGRPLTITIPGTSYYREELLSGDYMLYVQVQARDKFPPIPEDGDFVYGEGHLPISFPFDGVAHRATERAMDVTLQRVGCPAPTPHRCPDRTCTVDAAECSGSECGPPPDDSAVLTCRYRSQIGGTAIDNCADFPTADRWTSDGVRSFCAAQLGAVASSVVVTQGGGHSCLVELGGFSSSSRCAAVDQTRRWWAYGTPEGICNAFIGSYEGPGPFCSAY